MSILRPMISKFLAGRNQALVYLGTGPREAERNTASLAQEYALRRVLAECRINCVVDVGANVGQFAGRLRECGYTGRIASVEPFEQSFRQLQQAMVDDPAWAGFNYAAGAVHGQADLHVMPSSVLNSLCEPDPTVISLLGEDGRSSRVQAIQVRRLDDVWGELMGDVEDPCVFLKIDTQGFDHAVLEGAEGVLDRVSLLQVEVAVQHLYGNTPDWKQLLDRLGQCGWQIIGLFPAAMTEAEGAVIEFDCLLHRACLPVHQMPGDSAVA